jgi:cyclopropane-fatty-acyl-phospholipid synthase
VRVSFAEVANHLTERLRFGADDAERLIRRLFRDHPSKDFAVRLWDGRDVAFSPSPAVTLVFTDRDTFRACLGSSDPAQFAEAYLDRRLLIEGDPWDAIRVVSYLRTVDLGLREILGFAAKLAVPASSHTAEQDARDVQAHYDLSDEFFRLFLDERMVYSCAYFASPGQPLEAAQARKLDLVCRKLRLQPGDSFLDIGCGWGALVIWAAERYGVRAHGITLSPHQAAEARRRVQATGLASRVTIDERHYADLPAGAYDKAASIGMCEHVGIAQLPAYFHAACRALRPRGLFLNHGITRPRQRRVEIGGSFVIRHVFPGSEIDDLSHLQGQMEDANFEVLDVESLRPHYALTLAHWYRRFRAARDRAGQFVPERVLRAWDLYLAGCAQAFLDGVISVHQVLVGKPDAQGRTALPLTREDLLLTGRIATPPHRPS